MAFPVLQTADTQSGNADSSTITLAYPTNLVAGDLILFQIGIAATRNVNAPSDSGFVWTFGPGVGSSFSGVTTVYGKKVATGLESGTFTVTFGTGDEHTWRTMRITGWGGTLGTTFDNASTCGDVAMTNANGNNNTPDPPNLDPDHWLSEDTLWFALDTSENGVAITGYPLASNQYSQTRGCTSGGCTQSTNVSSLDPGTFTTSGGQTWRTATIAIRPTAIRMESAPLIGLVSRG